MSLAPGTRLGPYEVVSAIGAGGMGEVYKARDTRLKRTVAIKVLHEHLTQDPSVSMLVQREAEAVAALEHPHICILYDIGHHDDVAYLVMEYLEGETLARRLDRGPLTEYEVLRYAGELASALDEAHRRGIVHRDLKPANIMVTKAGLKLLDFGVATMRAPAVETATETSLPTRSATPTLEGRVVGTLPYMAPEQLEGREPDARTDIWAFGVTLFEMLTGKKAFSAQTDVGLIAAILNSDPPAIPAERPLPLAALDRVVRRCLARDPEERWQSARDILAVLKLLTEVGVSAAPTQLTRSGRSRHLVVGICLAVLVLSTFWYLLRRTPPHAHPVVRFRVSVPPHVTLSPASVGVPGAQIALSPDGGALAFVAAPVGGRRLVWIRRLRDLDATAVPGTADAHYPFWSPTGRQIGYFANGKLMRVNVDGGVPQIIAEARDGRGASWSHTGDIVFAPDSAGPLYRVHESGGVPSQITSLDQRRGEKGHKWPQFLPNGRRFLLFVESDNRDTRGIYHSDLEGRARPFVIASSHHGTYAESGHLLFVRDGDLVAQQFNERSASLTGPVLPLIPNVGGAGHGYGSYSVANEVLGYAGTFHPERELVWFARTGARLERADGPADYVDFRLGPDGQLAVARNLPETRTSDLFLIDPGRQTERGITAHPALDASPVWSPDAKRLAFRSKRRGRSIDGTNDLYEVSADRLGSDRLLLSTPAGKYPTDWSPDGRALLYHTENPETGWDVFLLPLGEDPVPKQLIATSANEMQAKFSPDGRYLAFTSDESGRPEVYVKANPPDARRWQISTAGGTQPEWNISGRELVFLALDGTLMAASVRIRPQFQLESARADLRIPAPSFAAPFSPRYALSADGRKVLVNATMPDGGAPAIELLLNWTARLTSNAH